MARPIADTPVVTGKDAKRFRESIKKEKPVTKQELERREEVFEYFKSIAKFEL
jgi:hypothetical protein